MSAVDNMRRSHLDADWPLFSHITLLMLPGLPVYLSRQGIHIPNSQSMQTVWLCMSHIICWCRRSELLKVCDLCRVMT